MLYIWCRNVYAVRYNKRVGTKKFSKNPQKNCTIENSPKIVNISLKNSSLVICDSMTPSFYYLLTRKSSEKLVPWDPRLFTNNLIKFLMLCERKILICAIVLCQTFFGPTQDYLSRKPIGGEKKK